MNKYHRMIALNKQASEEKIEKARREWWTQGVK